MWFAVGLEFIGSGWNDTVTCCSVLFRPILFSCVSVECSVIPIATSEGCLSCSMSFCVLLLSRVLLRPVLESHWLREIRCFVLMRCVRQIYVLLCPIYFCCGTYYSEIPYLTQPRMAAVLCCTVLLRVVSYCRVWSLSQAPWSICRIVLSRLVQFHAML